MIMFILKLRKVFAQLKPGNNVLTSTNVTSAPVTIRRHARILKEATSALVM